MAKAKPTLRFGALIRVSTEQQEKQGESLRTQKKQLEVAVRNLGGVITAWYGGQEHATVGWEKKEIDRLLKDAAKSSRPFDATIVADPSRWSRDNVASETGLTILQKHRIRFFVMTQEHDLYNPDARLYLALSTVIAGYQAGKQNQKSIENRIERAKRGLPVCGKLPYGRTFDHKTEKWGIDHEKKHSIQEIAKRYLAGEKLSDLADEYGHNHSNLHKILTKRGGTTWEQRFDVDKLNIHEVVETPIPELLPCKTIAAILQKAKANKTYQHGANKHPYLLARMVFCGHCGYAMFGQTNHNGHRYYRHAHSRRVRECQCPKAWVAAEILEGVVMRRLFECFGNPKAVQQAIELATPDLERITADRQRQVTILDSLQKITVARNKILGLIEKDAITEPQAEQKLRELQQRETRLQEELDRLQDGLMHIPTPDKIKTVARQVAGRFSRLNCKIDDANHALDKMTWEEKRHLAETVFSGTTADGKRMGIYIEWLDGQERKRKKQWKYTLTGHLIHITDNVLCDDYAQDDHYCFGWAGLQKDLVTKSASY